METNRPEVLAFVQAAKVPLSRVTEQRPLPMKKQGRSRSIWNRWKISLIRTVNEHSRRDVKRCEIGEQDRLIEFLFTLSPPLPAA